jgi:hypothetical protein
VATVLRRLRKELADEAIEAAPSAADTTTCIETALRAVVAAVKLNTQSVAPKLRTLHAQLCALPVVKLPKTERATECLDTAYHAVGFVCWELFTLESVLRSLHVQAVAARDAHAAAPSGWAVDLYTILKRPGSNENAPAHLAHAVKLDITYTANDVAVESSLAPAVLAAIKRWYELWDMHSDNIDTVDRDVLNAQVTARFQNVANLQSWVRRHLPGKAATLDLSDTEDLRYVLRKVLFFAYKIEHATQKPYFTSTTTTDADGQPRRYKYLREIELMVLCI